MNRVRIDLAFNQAGTNEVVAREMEGLNKNTSTEEMGNRIIPCPGLSVTTEITGIFSISITFASNAKYDVKLDGFYNETEFRHPTVSFVNKTSDKILQIEIADYFTSYGAVSCSYHCF